MGSHIDIKDIDIAQAAMHVLFALGIGVVCGLASVVLCICVGWAYDVFLAAEWLVWLLPLIGALEALAYKAVKLAPNMTTDRLVGSIRENRHVSAFLAPGILLTTCMSILCGASVGKEAGALQIGASLGETIAAPMGIKRVRRSKQSEPLNDYPAACGMAACFSALFFAPLGSCMFMLELTRFKVSVVKHLPTILVACFVAYFVASIIGIGDVITKVPLPGISWPIVFQCVVIGVATALMGSILSTAIKGIQATTQRISKRFEFWAIVGGAIFAVLVWVFGWDAFSGTGGELLNEVLEGRFEIPGFLIKALLTMICLGFWLKGGEIMPSFCIGGLLGASVFSLMGSSPVFGAAIGIFAFFAAFSRCPFAAFLMGCEILGWGFAPFMAVAIFVSFMFSYPIGMYGEGVDRQLRAFLERIHEKVT